MKTDKKLKRGLTDLSILFSGGVALPPQKLKERVSFVEAGGELSSPDRLPRLICSAFIHSPEIFQMVDLFKLLDQVKLQFEKVFLLSLLNSDDGIRLQEAANRVTFGQISSSYLEEIYQPRLTARFPHDFSDTRKTLVVFDSVHSSAKGLDSLPLSSCALELLDHCVFVIPVNLDQLVFAYEAIRSCLARHPALRCSILLVGRGAHIMWELVFERFNSILSEFLGYDLGFLGWIEDGVMRLNPELLLVEGDALMQSSSKARLSESLIQLDGARSIKPRGAFSLRDDFRFSELGTRVTGFTTSS